MKKFLRIAGIALLAVALVGVVTKFDFKKPTKEKEYTEMTYVAFGDSITYGVDGITGERATTPYPTLVGDMLELKTVTNKGVSGATLCNVDGRTNMTQEIFDFEGKADIISVMLGVNDYTAGVPLGNEKSKTNTTIYGSLYLIAEHLSENYSDSFVFFMTPYPTSTGETKNTAGYTLEDVATAVKDVAEKFDIPVLDMYENGEYETEMNKEESDGVHPSESFFKKYTAPQIVYFLKANLD